MHKSNKMLGVDVYPLGLGTGRLASLGAGYSSRDARSLVHAAADLGVNFIDTADSYGSSDCESLLGSILREMPRSFFISTKVGYRFADFPRPFKWLNQFGKKAMQRARLPQRFDKKYISACLEGSLRRLRLQQIDFFFLHDPSATVLAQDDWREAATAALVSGKIRQLGISSPHVEVQQIALADPLCELIQAPLPLRLEYAEAELKPIVANHVFGGWVGDGQVAAVAAESGHTSRSLLLAYAASRPAVRVVLSGTGSAQHLRENAAAIQRKLDSSIETKLESVLSGDAMAGRKR